MRISIRIVILLIISIALISVNAFAEFWEDEKLIDFNGNSSGYVLNGGEKSISIISDFNYGISDRFTIGTCFLLDLFIIPNISMKIALMKEDDRKPAISLNASGMIAFIMQLMADGMVEQYSDDIESINAGMYSYNISLGASKSMGPDFCLHGSLGITQVESEWEVVVKEGKEDPLSDIGEFMGDDIFDIYVGLGTHYKFNRKLMGIGSVNFSFTSVKFQPRISILWAPATSFRVLVGVPFIFNLYWQF